jgi:DNA adenine methylase
VNGLSQLIPDLDPGRGVHRAPVANDGPLKAPFPWAGGKSKVADLVWERLGNTDNYVEPFAGSLAVLLRRPADHFAGGYRVETCNDADHFITNFWRAVSNDPEAVARWADWPVTEVDLHARHKWLMRSEYAAGWRERMAADPDHFDAKIAGWWRWGLCCWIGSGWCSHGVDNTQRPDIAGSTFGPNNAGVLKLNATDHLPHGRPQLTDAYDLGRGVNGGAAELSRQVPLISGPGDGVYSVAGQSTQIPILRGGTGQGVYALPGIGTTDARRAWLTDWMRRLAARLRLVRTCYGHWSRICDSDSTMTRLGTTGVFLDPPYPTKTSKGTRAKGLYANDGQDLDGLRDEVLAWCRKWGGTKGVRAAVCGYEGDGYEALVSECGWTEESWEASGGYGNQSKDKKGKASNAKRERIWFSPFCLGPRQPDLFAHITEEDTA